VENCRTLTRNREIELGLENALARLVRRRWPEKTVENVQAEWDLSRGQAQGVVYAHASRSTINAIIRHKRGGLRLLIALGCVMTGETLPSLIATEVATLELEAIRKDAEARALADLEDRLARLPLIALDDLAVDQLGRLSARAAPSVARPRPSTPG